MLVFALYKREAARLEQFLQRNNFNAVAVHGDKGQVRYTEMERREGLTGGSKRARRVG